MYELDVRLKNELVNGILVPLFFSKNSIDTEDIMTNGLDNARIVDTIPNSFSNLKKISEIKLANATFKRELLNFNEDSIKELLFYILDYNKEKINIDTRIIMKYDNKEIEFNIVLLHNDYVKVAVRVNNRYISVSNQLSKHSRENMLIVFNFKILDETYTKTKLTLSFGEDVHYKDHMNNYTNKFTDTYIQGVVKRIDGIELSMIEVTSMESIILDIFATRKDKFENDVLINCIKRLTEFFTDHFSGIDDLFIHTLPIDNEDLNLFLTYNMSIEKYNTVENTEDILPLIEIDKVLYYMKLFVDDTTLIDGSYGVNLLGIKDETIESFNRYLDILKERTQEDISRNNCEYGFSKFIDYTKAKSRDNYIEYSGRVRLELYSCEIDNWNKRVKDTINKDISDKIMTSSFLNKKGDPWIYY